jgi:hypothetical protein
MAICFWGQKTVCGLGHVSEKFTLCNDKLSEFFTKVSERDTQFDLYERMFMFSDGFTHR